MNYREVEPGQWLKPVGYGLFTFIEKKNLWECWYKGMTGDIGLYQSEVFTPTVPAKDFLVELKTIEAFARVNVGDGDTHFELAAFDL